MSDFAQFVSGVPWLIPVITFALGLGFGHYLGYYYGSYAMLARHTAWLQTQLDEREQQLGLRPPPHSSARAAPGAAS